MQAISSILESAIAHTEAATTTPVVAPATTEAIELTLAQREDRTRKAATAAGGKLERIIAQGQLGARDTIARIMSEVPTDYIVPAKGISWDVVGLGQVRVALNDYEREHGTGSTVHPHAFGQALGRYEVPTKYASKLLGTKEWGHALAQHTLNEHAQHDSGRMLVRTVGSQIRAFLSDKYRRLDSRPLLDAFLGAVADAGLTVYSGVASDVRVSVRALLPEVIDIEGDPNVFGIEWSNSDYGASKHLVRLFGLRMVCINGMIGESAMSNVHLGRRIEGDAQLSKRTHDLDTATMASAIRDIVSQTMEPAALKGRIDRVRQSAREQIEVGESLPAALRRALSKPEQDRLRELFNGSEAVMLPPEPTTYRLSNVLSWMANTVDNPDRRLELERLAGETAGI